jgi:type VI secretion system protein ImpI
MTLILTIENQESVPDGVPLSVRLGTKGGLDIGRSANLDWTLPDPSRFISGKHCEVRYRDGAYWLYDLSTNGTFLNYGSRRLQGPHRLCDGDRLGIGSYIIKVTIEPDPVEEEDRAQPAEPALTLGELRAQSGGLGFADAAPAPPRANGTPAPPVGQGGSPAEPAAAPMEAEARAWREPERAPCPPISAQAAEQDLRHREAAGAGQEHRLDEHLRRFAAAAGIPEHILAGRDSLQVAAELGALTRIAVESLIQLLGARFKAERLARVSRQTMIQALDNNPLKFAPTPDDALKIMFGPRTSGYLDARRAFESAFTDLKTHQINTFAAMQQAVRMLVEDLDPESVEAAVGPDKGLDALFSSRKARLWDMYLARWQAKALRHEDGLVGAFMLYFGECYDEAKGAESGLK